MTQNTALETSPAQKKRNKIKITVFAILLTAVLTIFLYSYIKPRIEENQYGSESVTYMGQDTQKKWTRIESYGPKFVENIVQAISRDILADAMKRLTAAGHRIVGHVHDEVIVEAPPITTIQEICEIMQKTPGWLPGIDLRADGYECGYYMKAPMLGGLCAYGPPI